MDLYSAALHLNVRQVQRYLRAYSHAASLPAAEVAKLAALAARCSEGASSLEGFVHAVVCSMSVRRRLYLGRIRKDISSPFFLFSST